MPTTVAFPKIAASGFSRDLQISDDELHSLLKLARDLKQHPQAFSTAAQNRSVALLFEKPSLRTRFTFELAIQQMGGNSVFIDGPIGTREPIQDIARNLDRWVDAIVARTFTQQTIDSLAKWANVPVINALSDLYHPCQALADILTLQEHFGTMKGRKLAFLGDGNNVAHSLMLSSARLGMHFALACPEGYLPDSGIKAQAEGLATISGSTITVTHNPAEALSNADAVYTDVWASMGQESEAARRAKIFAPFQVNAHTMAQANPGALFLHCLPAHREEEVTNEVIESKQSVVFDQAENRLHAQKALLLMLLPS
jgi:ornithine carbamoyltransferase